MALGHWLATAIVILAVVALVIGIVYFMDKLNEPLKKINRFQEDLQHRSDFYQEEIQYLSDRVDAQVQQGQALANQAQVEMDKFNRLQDESQKLGSQLSYINSIKGDVAQAALKEGKDYLQEEVPRKAKKWKQVAEKTIHKQKARHSDH